MAWNVNNFITSVVGVSVAVVVFAMVALPIIGGITFTEDQKDLEAIVNVIPIFIAIGILMACVYMFITRKN